MRKIKQMYPDTNLTNEREQSVTRHSSAERRGRCEDVDRHMVRAAIAVMALTAVLCMLRMLFFEDISDDIIYRYKLVYPHSFYNAYGAERVTSLQDVFESQCSEWLHHSGRFMLHVVTQIFTALLGRGWFSVCTAFVIFVTMVLFWHFAMRRNSRYPLVWAVLVSIMYVQLYIDGGDSQILFLMAYNCNYVWPLPLVLVFMAVVQRVARGARPGRWGVAGCVALAFLTGSTQEVYILPLCAATFLILVRNLYLRRGVSRLFVAMCVCLWVGSALVVLAPGTLQRASTVNLGYKIDSSLVWNFVTVADRPLFLTAVALGICCGVRYDWRKVARLCPFELLCLVLSVMMVLVVNNGPRSFSGLQFFSFLVSLALLAQLMKARVMQRWSRVVRAVSVAVFVLFGAYEVNLVVSSYRYQIQNHDIVEAYTDSPDGIVEYKPITHGFLTGNKVLDFVASRENYWNNGTLQIGYGKPGKPLILLTDEDMRRFAGIKAGCDSLRVPGSAGYFRLTDRILVRPVTAADSIGPVRIWYGNSGWPWLIEKLHVAWHEWRYGEPVPLIAEVIDENTADVSIRRFPAINTRFGVYEFLFLDVPPLAADKRYM